VITLFMKPGAVTNGKDYCSEHQSPLLKRPLPAAEKRGLAIFPRS
jgi:hypothetical protein